MLAEVSQSEGNVPRFILRGQPCHRRSDRIWSIVLDEPKQREKCSLSKNR